MGFAISHTPCLPPTIKRALQHPPSHLSRPATLAGYTRHRVKNQVFPAIVPAAAPTSKVGGKVCVGCLLFMCAVCKRGCVPSRACACAPSRACGCSQHHHQQQLVRTNAAAAHPQTPRPTCARQVLLRLSQKELDILDGAQRLRSAPATPLARAALRLQQLLLLPLRRRSGNQNTQTQTHKTRKHTHQTQSKSNTQTKRTRRRSTTARACRRCWTTTAAAWRPTCTCGRTASGASCV